VIPASLLGSVVAGALGARRKPYKRASSFLLQPGVLLGAAGLAWGAYEVLRSRPGMSPGLPTRTVVDTSAGAPPPIPSAPPPVPPVPAAGGLDPLRRLVALALSAARADGELSEEEYGRLVQSAREQGGEQLVTEELARRRPLSEIVSGAGEGREKLYALAFGIVRADGGVTGAERVYLAQLAQALGLDPQATRRIEKETADGIDEAFVDVKEEKT